VGEGESVTATLYVTPCGWEEPANTDISVTIEGPNSETEQTCCGDAVAVYPVSPCTLLSVQITLTDVGSLPSGVRGHRSAEYPVKLSHSPKQKGTDFLGAFFPASPSRRAADEGQAAHVYLKIISERDDRFLAKLRFHLLGLAHLETHRDNSACAYTQKIVKLAKMLRAHGHTVLFYGVEGSDVSCDEMVLVSDRKTLEETYGAYDRATQFYKHDPNDLAHRTFNANAIQAILKRKQARDILLCPMGNYQKPVADAAGLMTVEPGIGYTGVFSGHRVFESYAWMHYVYGLLGIEDGAWYDAVIPNYFDPADFRFRRISRTTCCISAGSSAGRASAWPRTWQGRRGTNSTSWGRAPWKIPSRGFIWKGRGTSSITRPWGQRSGRSFSETPGPSSCRRIIWSRSAASTWRRSSAALRSSPPTGARSRRRCSTA
jgi:hypothetical protein